VQRRPPCVKVGNEQKRGDSSVWLGSTGNKLKEKKGKRQKKRKWNRKRNKTT
jgi:hypothetical protein